MEIRHTRSATRHRISRERSAYVVHNAETVIPITAPKDAPAEADQRTLHLGYDSQGFAIEVVTIADPDRVTGLIVIHAMQMRRKYQNLL